jgi:hypothetical protein
MASSTTRAAVTLFGLSLVAVPSSPAADKEPQLPPTVTVLGRKLALQIFGHNPDEDVAAQYLSAKETVDRWTLMLAVRVFKEKLTPDQAAARKDEEVKARRAKGDPMANAVSFAKGTLRVVDFVVSQPPIVEHSVMSFSAGADGRLVSHQLARRYYQPSSEADAGLRAFMGQIKTNRDRYVREIERLSKAVLR